jgi:hypothetical protein
MKDNIMKMLKKFKFACIILCLLTLLASCATYNNDETTLPEDTKTEKSTAEDTNVEDTTAEETTFNGDNTAVDTADIPQTEIPDGVTALYSYTLQSSPRYYYAMTENPATDDNENTIPCAIYICENADAYINGSAGSLYSSATVAGIYSTRSPVLQPTLLSTPTRKYRICGWLMTSTLTKSSDIYL